MRILFRFILKAFGWKIVGTLPDEKKYIITVAPHTTNWDFVIGILTCGALGVKIHFLAKKQIFIFPFKHLLQLLGGIPIDRSKKSNVVDDMVSLIGARDILRLAVTPEGTR
ncbi:MAG: 1-acyl-sn-glycerol-3-phosphate acyltransferase, partial [Legionellales bacterium]